MKYDGRSGSGKYMATKIPSSSKDCIQDKIVKADIDMTRRKFYRKVLYLKSGKTSLRVIYINMSMITKTIYS